MMNKEILKPPFSRELTDEELASLSDEDIDYSDIPKVSSEWFAKARIVYPHERKQQLTVRLDADVVDFFKAKGKGYQTRMNEVLRTYVEAMRK
jgi:uncharacterized protein (DUF4415 family)